MGTGETSWFGLHARLGPGFAGSVSFLAFAALGLIPLVGVFVAVLAPLPLAMLAGSGRPSALGWGWIAVILAGVALATGSTLVGIVLLGYLLVAAWPAVAVELWTRNPWPTGRWAAVVASVPLAAGAAVVLLAASPAAPDAFMADVLLPDGEGEAARLAGWLGPRGGEAEQALQWVVPILASLVPALGSLYVVAVAMWLRRRLPLLGFPVGSEPFNRFKSEEWLPAAFVAGALGWAFLGGVLKWLAGNLLVVVLGLYFLHGVAIILFHLGRRLGENRWVRLVVMMVGLQFPVALGFAALGLVDAFVELRRGERRE